MQLTDPYLCQLGTATATATIVHPQVTISSPDETAGTFTVPNDGTRREIDLGAVMDSSYPGLSSTTLQLTAPAGVGGLTFYSTAQTGGTQLVPDASGVLNTFTMPSTGNFSDTIWVTGTPGSVPVALDFAAIGPAAPGMETTLQPAATGSGVANVVAMMGIAAAPGESERHGCSTPSGTFTITTGTVPVKGTGNQMLLGMFAWGFSMRYAPAATLPAGITFQQEDLRSSSSRR